MHWIIDFIVSHKSGSSLFFVILLSSLLLNSTESTKIKVARYLGTTIFLPAQVTVSQVRSVRNIFEENKELVEDIEKLKLENASLREVVSQYSDIKRGLAYQDSSSYSLIPANIVVREPNFLFRSVVINVGKEDSVEPYMPVVSIDGVVGKVIRVMDKSSLVQLIRKPDEFVSVLHRASGAVGILSSNGDRKLEVEFRKHQNLSVGDTLYTSGFGGIYPPGLSVGTITKIKDAQNPLYNDVIVTPTVNFDKLRSVFVIKISSQWNAFQMELDSLLRDGESD